MFSCLDEIGLWHVSELATEVSLPAGHVLMQAGQEGAGLFVVLDGTVNVELAGGTKIDVTPGEFIGELSLARRRSRAHRARPHRDAREVPRDQRDDFERLLETYPQIAVSMLHVLAQRLADTDDMLRAH